MSYRFQDERRVLNLAEVGLPEVPVFGHYKYCSAHPGLSTHTHPRTIEICYLERGCQVYCVGGREYRLTGGDVFVTAPGEPHDTGGQPEERGVLYWLNLRVPPPGESLLMLPPEESALLVERVCGLPARHFAGRPVLKQILDGVFGLHDQPANAFHRMAIANHLVRYVLEVIQCAHRREGSRCTPLIASIAQRITSQPEQDYSLMQLAEEAGLSLSRFKTKFKSQIGVAPHEFILRAKMEAAKELLRQEGRSVTDTAISLGFSSSQYFATVFKRFTQQTPVEFSTKGPVTPLRPGSLQPQVPMQKGATRARV